MSIRTLLLVESCVLMRVCKTVVLRIEDIFRVYTASSSLQEIMRALILECYIIKPFTASWICKAVSYFPYPSR